MKRVRLINERKIKGLTQEQVGKIVGVSKQMISLIESGQCNPSISVANALEDLFGIPQRELLAKDGKKQTA